MSFSGVNVYHFGFKECVGVPSFDGLPLTSENDSGVLLPADSRLIDAAVALDTPNWMGVVAVYDVEKTDEPAITLPMRDLAATAVTAAQKWDNPGVVPLEYALESLHGADVQKIAGLFPEQKTNAPATETVARYNTNRSSVAVRLGGVATYYDGTTRYPYKVSPHHSVDADGNVTFEVTEPEPYATITLAMQFAGLDIDRRANNAANVLRKLVA